MKVAAFYKFMAIADPKDLAKQIATLQQQHPVSGTLIVADEGINATIAGQDAELEAFLDALQTLTGTLQAKYSFCEHDPFHRFKVKIKDEIVTFEEKAVGPLKQVGTYVSPEQWNNLVQRDDVLLLDTRNRYETRVGVFKGAEDPDVDDFMAFKTYLDKLIAERKVDKVAMYCTGGIRCEKSTGYALSKGVKEVYHLEGGILNYLEKVPESESLWEGECFVFDHRVSVDHQLNSGHHKLCHSCGYPLSVEERAHTAYEEGVSCHLCIDSLSDTQKERFRERRKQMQLAAEKGHKHIGANMGELLEKKLQAKQATAQSSKTYKINTTDSAS